MARYNNCSRLYDKEGNGYITTVLDYTTKEGNSYITTVLDYTTRKEMAI